MKRTKGALESRPPTRPPRQFAPGECVHHWAVASPEPGVKALPATCRKCGAERAFRAPTEDGPGYWNGKGLNGAAATSALWRARRLSDEATESDDE